MTDTMEMLFKLTAGLMTADWNKSLVSFVTATTLPIIKPRGILDSRPEVVTTSPA